MEESRDDEWCTYEVRKAQEGYCPFDLDDIHHSLVDPYVRIRQERIEYGKEATFLYHEMGPLQYSRYI